MNTPETPPSIAATPFLDAVPFESGQIATPFVSTPVVDPNNPPWGIPSALFVLAASYVLLFLSQAAFLLPYIFSKKLMVGGEALKQFLLTDKTALLLLILSIFPAHLLTLAVIWAVVTKFGKRPFWAALGWSWSENFGFWSSALAAVALLLVGLTIAKLIGGGETDVEKIISSSTAARYATALLATFTAPLIEEMAYRGVLYPVLQRSLGSNFRECRA